jgi:hypothetical protein
MESEMNESQPDLRLSAETREQMHDLLRWWGEAEATRTVEAAISKIWRRESDRRPDDVPWVVQPGAQRFADQESALHWLEQEGAAPVDPEGHTWARYDEEGVSATYLVEPVASEIAA